MALPSIPTNPDRTLDHRLHSSLTLALMRGSFRGRQWSWAFENKLWDFFHPSSRWLWYANLSCRKRASEINFRDDGEVILIMSTGFATPMRYLPAGFVPHVDCGQATHSTATIWLRGCFFPVQFLCCTTSTANLATLVPSCSVPTPHFIARWGRQRRMHLQLRSFDDVAELRTRVSKPVPGFATHRWLV